MKRFNKNTDLRELSYLEIEAFQEEDPEAYEEAAKRFDDRIVSTHARYAAKNPDFDSMWKSGKLQEYMKHHPGHNAISAHFMLSQTVPPAEEDASLKDCGAHRVTQAIATRLSKSRLGKPSADRLGQPEDGPQGESADVVDTLPNEGFEDFNDKAEAEAEPNDINTLEDLGKDPYEQED